MRAHTKINPIGPLLQLFFAEHLVVHKRASAQTIASYRDIPPAASIHAKQDRNSAGGTSADGG
jgi:hypothetical protein